MPSTQTDRVTANNDSVVRIFSGPGFACQVLFTDTIVEINNGTTTATVVTLPDVGGGPYTIADGIAAAGAHPIVIQTSAALLIGTISVNRGALTVAWDGAQWLITGAYP